MTKSTVVLDLLVPDWKLARRLTRLPDATARTVFTGMNTQRNAFKRSNVDVPTKENTSKKTKPLRMIVQGKYPATLVIRGLWKDRREGG